MSAARDDRSSVARRRVLALGVGALALALVETPRAWAGPAPAAGGVQLQVQLERGRVNVGEGVRYVIEIALEGRGGRAPEPELPDFSTMGIELKGPMTSQGQSTSWINGQVTRRTTISYTYFLLPTKPGKFKLPVHVKHNGAKIRAPRIPVLEVVGAAVPEEAVAASGADKPQEAPGDLFLWLRVDKPRPYVGEQVIYAIELYERLGRRVDISLTDPPGFQDFWTEELNVRPQRVEAVGGQRFRVHTILRRALFPQRAGELTIGRPQADVGIVADLFRPVQRLRRVAGQALKLEVQPLPAAGQPAGFSPNNVGNFKITTEVDRAAVKQGEPLTLTLTITGTGNIKAIDPGEWPALPGMRRYDPKVELATYEGERVGGERRYEFLVIPEQAGALEIPAHRFSFFNPATERYQTVASRPIALEVTADPNAPAPSSDGAAAPVSEATAQATSDDADLFAPLMTPESVPRVDAGSGDPRRAFRRWLYGMLGVPAAAAAITGGQALWRRFGPDDAAREAAARAARRRSLAAEAEAAVAGGEGFYGAVSQLLQGAAVERAGPEGHGLPRRRLLALLRSRGVSEDDVSGLGALLDRCDAARFGAAASERAEEREAVLEQALSLVRRSSLATRGREGA